MIQDLSPILAVHDVELALDYYEKKLGFSILGKMGTPVEYGIVHREKYSIHFKRIDNPLIAKGAFEGNLNAGKGGAYITVEDVDAVAAELVKRGASDSIEPESKDYGMRDFWIADPFGYAIAFGTKV